MTEPAGPCTVRLTRTHWEALITQGRLHGWTEARTMGLTVAQCDLIADAAVQGVRELMEQWAQQQDEKGKGEA